ncbi:MAG: metallophosphoesterase [Bacteroidales bacterium]
MFDIIGDIHGYAITLIKLLEKLGYRLENGHYSHPGRKAIFVGDFIDRGPRVFESLRIVKPMVESGSALALMGNHEYNAICFHTKTKNGKNWLRAHSQKNINQHVTTLEAINDNQMEWEEYLEWFKSLPLLLDLGDLRVIHACWEEKTVTYLNKRLKNNIMDNEFLFQSAIPGTMEFRAVETCLKGYEIFLPIGLRYTDNDGTERNKIRVKWWKPINSETYRSISLGNDLNIPDIKVPVKQIQKLFCYPAENVPVFIGHYWKTGNPQLLAANVCCVDYSVAKMEKLVAYRWHGERLLSYDNFTLQECIG